jgi:hypothetical protein
MNNATVWVINFESSLKNGGFLIDAMLQVVIIRWNSNCIE